jgi:ubiquinone/menaquinone biosynthesis C-methylase UbiE
VPRIKGDNSSYTDQYDYYEVELRNIYKDAARYQNVSHQKLIENFINRGLIKTGDFAEIGFGAGLTLRWASRYFKKVWGFDVSPANVKVTQKELIDEGVDNFEIQVLNILDYNTMLKEKFDIVTCIHGLEHFSEKEYDLLFANIKQYLKKDGYFTGALPFNLDFSYRMCPNCKHVFEIDGHLSKHNKDSLIELFDKHRFAILFLDNYNPYYIHHLGKKEYVLRTLQKLLFRSRKTYQLEFIVTPS